MESTMVRCDDCGRLFEPNGVVDTFSEILCPWCQMWADHTAAFDAKWPDDDSE